MLLDTQSLFSENQAITTGTILSENVVKFGVGDVSFVPILIQATQDFSDLTNLKVKVETSADETFEEVKVLSESTLNKDSLKAGATYPIAYLPKGNKGYIRLSYTVEGSIETTGKITAGTVATNELSWHEV